MRRVAVTVSTIFLTWVVGFGSSPVQAAVPPLAASPQASKVAVARRTVYLTFDDGPSATWTPRYLAVLEKYGAKATFFATGANVRAHPRTTARIHREGHLLANHTWSHANLTRLSKGAAKSQLTRTQSALGPYKTHCMRPPYGATNTTVRRWTKEAGLKTVLWDVDTRDWEDSQTATGIYNRVIRGVHNGSTVLMHDGGNSQRDTLAALKRILPKLKSMGYVFKVLPDC
ncbi:polysaccharide deacetylase family protein [Actinoplanes sp. NPDC049548]|uniref:polysaccharide deacetylase family protein n=1 Tax=Actinoplanes sp. NPDC049548 TaxID=3155152 RepID=UPI0034420368